MVAASPSVGSSPLVHVKRAFGWNLGKVVPSAKESAALAAAGVTDPAVMRYAAWRRSLLLVALVPALLAALLAVYDVVEDGLDEYSDFGAALYGVWLLAAVALPVACWRGIRAWQRPGAAARSLRAAWLIAFLIPLFYSLVPSDWIYGVPEEPTATPASATAPGGAATAEKLAALEHIALEFVWAGAAFLLLLPAVLSVLPGAMNGCLRIKSAFPAAQLPGWLLVCAAPMFLLFWAVLLVLINPAADSALLVGGILLWAGGPLAYALRGRVFVQSQISAADATKIGGVKRLVSLVSLVGIALVLTFVATKKVAGLSVAGTDEETAMNLRLEELGDDDHVTLEDVGIAYEESTSLIYALDTSMLRLVLDTLAKLLLVTAVFADLILRATLSAWRNDRALRSRTEATAYDANAAAATAALGGASAG